jgi:hypothetical protein
VEGGKRLRGEEKKSCLTVVGIEVVGKIRVDQKEFRVEGLDFGPYQGTALAVPYKPGGDEPLGAAGP